MQNGLAGRRIAFLATHGVEQVELTEPWKTLQDAGAEVHLVSLEHGEIRMMRHDEKGDSFPVDRVLSEVQVGEYDGLVLPGGVANPDRLRTDPAAVSFARGFMDADKPVAAICHAPWLLVEADVVRGRTLTSWPSLRKDIENAGGEWVDKAVQMDQKLITSRKPADLPQFCARVLDIFARAIEERKLDRMVEQSFPASDPLPGPGAIGMGADDDDDAPLEQRMP